MASSTSPDDEVRKTPARPTIPDYELLRRIGQGAYGEVWLARGVTGVLRAIKIVWRDRFRDPAPFEREFKGLSEFAAISLDDPSRMALLHVSRNEAAGFFFYVMEAADDAATGRAIDPASYVPLTLHELRNRRGRLPVAECLALAVGLARDLAGLHRRGLIHRDIKPSNVILVNGVAKLADIGLVAAAGEARTFVGTEGYVPPEGPGTPAGDVFAFGKVLYELLTGLDHRDFPRLPAGLDQWPDRDSFRELNEIVLRACEPARARRYADAGTMLQDLLALQAGRSLRRSHARRWVAGLAAAAVAAGAFFWYPRPAAPAASEKSIAVLPFANQSDDKDASSFFADGMHEDVVTHLAHIRDLRVVSRTSVMQYRDTKKPIPQIARELGVAYILEGSVRRAGNQLRITGQLIRAANDEHLWARSYTTELTTREMFAIQAALSNEIATALHAVLSPQEKKLIERAPTASLDAYDFYVKTRDLRNRLGTGLAALQEQEKLLERAVATDPQFGLAWATLAWAQSHLTYQHAARGAADPSALSARRAAEAVQRAQQLIPDSPEFFICRGWFYYFVERDFSRARAEFQQAAKLSPSLAEATYAVAMVNRRQGHWRETLQALHAAERLDPANPEYATEMVETALSGRRYAEAEVALRRAMALGRTGDSIPRLRVLLPLHARGELSAASPTEGTNLDLGLLNEKAAAPGARATLDAAFVLAAKGDRESLRALLDQPANNARQRLQREPTDVVEWSRLGVMEALLGQREAAQRCADKVRELGRETPDAWVAPEARINLAHLLAWNGDAENALREYERLLQTTSYRNAVGWVINVHVMRLHPAFTPLRGDPRFEALLNEPKHNAALF